MYDIAILGGGPAGLSAAINARARNRTTVVISNSYAENPLYRASSVRNYPGIAEVSGRELLERLHRQAEQLGAEFVEKRLIAAMPMGNSWMLSAEDTMVEAKAVILAGGVLHSEKFPGEDKFLGRGVSYCATCDGMLYRGKTVALVGSSAEAKRDAEFLRGIGCNVLEFADAARYEIRGTKHAEALICGGETYPVDGVFIIKDTVSVANLMSGLERSGAAISVGRGMETSIPGVFAAGDCTGKPYQAAKAVGEGNIAALSACEYIDKL